jgi:hypothetical protein
MSDEAIAAEIIEEDFVATRPPANLRIFNGGGVQDVVSAMNDLKLIRTFIAEELIDGIDYGVIPGTNNRKNLLLPGAQKVAMFFNVRPEYEIERVELGAGHVEYIVKTALISRTTEKKVGAGVGSCSSMEGKYRYRDAAPELTDMPVPKAYWDTRKVNPAKAAELIGGDEFKAVKTDNGWFIGRKTGEKVDNDNIYDLRNTILKMAKKRSLVDSSIGLGCLSELFTQDLEDIYDVHFAETDSKTDMGRVGRSGGAELTADIGPTGTTKGSRATNDSSEGVPSSSRPVPSDAPVSGSSPIITAKFIKENGKYAGERSCFVTDTNKRRWTFNGDKVGAMADKSVETGERMRLTRIQQNGNYNNVTDAQWVAT